MKTPQLEINPREMLRLEPDYVTGFCEGEATFTYVRNGKSINLRFGIKLSESDRRLIHSIMNFFAVGNIYSITARPSGPKNGNTGASWYYCVTSLRDLEAIVAHFDNYPMLGRKAENYKIWKQMYELKRLPRKADPIALNSLALILSDLSTKGRHNIKGPVLRVSNGRDNIDS